MVTCIRQWGKKMVDAGFQPLVLEAAMEVGAGRWGHELCLMCLTPHASTQGATEDGWSNFL